MVAVDTQHCVGPITGQQLPEVHCEDDEQGASKPRTGPDWARTAWGATIDEITGSITNEPKPTRLMACRLVSPVK